MLVAVFLALLQGRYEAPATFEPGASKHAGGAARLPLRPRLAREYEALTTAGKVAEIVRDDAKWMPYVIGGLISDDEKVARASFQALSDFCVKQQISSSEEGYKNPVRIELVNSAYFRGGEYTFWSEWWTKGHPTARGARIQGEDPARAKWDEIMQYLRAGGGFDDPKRPEGMAFQKVKNMGEGAYPYLLKYIDHEDVMLGRSAVRVLNALTGRDSPVPNDATKAALKSQWEEWIVRNRRAGSSLAPELLALLECGTTEPEARALVEKLSDDDPAERRKAVADLRPCVYRHEALLRRCRAEARDAEAAARLDEALAHLASMEDAIDEVRGDPEILLDDVPPGTPLEARRKALVDEIRARRSTVLAGRHPVGTDGPPSWSDEIRKEQAAAFAQKRPVDPGVIERLEALAREDLDRLGKKAARLREEGKAVDALLTLKAARPRFEITRSAAGLQKLIEELDK